MRRTSMLVVGLTVLAVAVLAAGCGGGSKSAATTEAVTTEAATTEAATTEEVTTEAATTEEATTEAETTEAATTTTSGFAGLSGGKCRDLAESSQKLSAAFTGAASGDALKKQAELLQDFAKKVPSEIRADFQVLADYVSTFAGLAAGLKAGQTPDPQTLAKLQKAATEIDQAKLTQASQNVAAWVQKNCAS
jgi:hypothetical protein